MSLIFLVYLVQGYTYVICMLSQNPSLQYKFFSVFLMLRENVLGGGELVLCLPHWFVLFWGRFKNSFLLGHVGNFHLFFQGYSLHT